MLYSHFIFCYSLILSPSIFPSTGVISNESAPCIRWPKYWSFSFKISSSNEYSGLISYRIDWFDLLAVQGTHKSLPQDHSSNSMLRHSAFFMVQLSCPYTSTGKTIVLIIWTFVGKVMSHHSFSFKEQASFNFMAAITNNRDSGTLRKESLSLFPLFPHLFVTKWLDQMPWSSFIECSILSQLFHSTISLSSRASLVPFHFLPLGWCHLHIWDYWYFSLQSWFQLELHPAQHFTWCTLHISWISRVTIYSLDV